MKFRVGSLSITGNFRENNEDNLYNDPQNRFFLVADGMGGQSAGERASALAMEIIPQRLAPLDFTSSSNPIVTRTIDAAIAQANAEIMALGELDPALMNMGTTVTFLVSANGNAFVGGVGDSRTYLLRHGKIEQLTKDHSLTQALLDAGTISPEEASTHRYRNVLHRYLGTKEGSQPTEPRTVILQPGDKFLLCTDGVTGGATDLVLKQILDSSTDPQRAAEQIVRAAEVGGSKDNITATVIFVET